MTVQRLLPLALLLAILPSSSVEAAEPAPASRGKRFRLHADTDLLGFTHFGDASRPRADRVHTNRVGFGFGRPTLTDSGACLGAVFGGCFLATLPTWGLGFGVTFADQRGVVGARFSFVVDGLFFDNDRGDTLTLVSGQFVPYFRWIFLPGRTFRPYLEGRFGVGGGSAIHRTDADARNTVNFIYPKVGGGGGLHMFVIDAFSVDLGMNLDYLAPHTSSSSRTPTPVGNITTEQDWEHRLNVINFAVLAGFSVWLG